MRRGPARPLGACLLAALLVPLSAVAGTKDTGGAVTVANQRDETVHVLIDGELAGVVAPGERQRIRAADGKHKVEVEDTAGALIVQERVVVEDDKLARLRVEAGMASIQVVNPSARPLIASVADRSGHPISVALGAGQVKELDILPGEVTLTVSNVWFGRREVVFSESRVVAPRAVDRVVIDRTDLALVRVDNPSEFAVRVEVGGIDFGTLPQGGTEYKLVPIGEQSVQMYVANDLVAQESATVDARMGSVVVADVRAGELVFENRSRSAVRVVVDGAPGAWVLPNHEQVFRQPVGLRSLDLVNAAGEVVESREVRVGETRRTYVKLARPVPPHTSAQPGKGHRESRPDRDHHGHH